MQLQSYRLHCLFGFQAVYHRHQLSEFLELLGTLDSLGTLEFLEPLGALEYLEPLGPLRFPESLGPLRFPESLGPLRFLEFLDSLGLFGPLELFDLFESLELLAPLLFARRYIEVEPGADDYRYLHAMAVATAPRKTW